MKNIFKILTIITVGLGLSGCKKPVPVITSPENTADVNRIIKLLKPYKSGVEIYLKWKLFNKKSDLKNSPVYVMLDRDTESDYKYILSHYGIYIW